MPCGALRPLCHTWALSTALTLDIRHLPGLTLALEEDKRLVGIAWSALPVWADIDIEGGGRGSRGDKRMKVCDAQVVVVVGFLLSYQKKEHQCIEWNDISR